MSYRAPIDQFPKQEDMDLDNGIDVDARKKRRNRTTQSCLNCHTSKRKCDRKRPCGRCITLGLTGLCVYEVDDPAARDDPNVDEVTHLRSRIAELESLVRELRGKPHPRWVDNNGGFRGDDRRLSRSARGSQRHEGSRSNSSSSSENHDSLSLEAVKTEHDPSHSPLYTMSPQFDPAAAGEPLSYFDIHRRTRDNYSPISPGITTNYSGSPFTDDSSSSYLGSRSSTHLPFGGPSTATPAGLQLPPPQCASNCTCVTNSSATPCLATLSHQLQSTLTMLRHLPEHAAIDVSCNVLRRISDLQASLSAPTPQRSVTLPSYSALPTPTNANLPASLSHAGHAQNGAEYRHGHDWHAVTTPTYHSYTGMTAPSDPALYHAKNVAYSVAA